MALIGSYRQQPRECLDYDIDYAPWLPPGDVIVDVEVYIDPPTLESSHAFTDQRVKVWCWDGISGTVHKVTVIATTANAAEETQPGYQLRRKEVEFKLRIRED